ncbi:MAG: helix-turn-helix transcriptional regulator [Planctomycetaceae bacterium]
MQRHIPPTDGNSATHIPNTSGFDQLSEHLELWRTHLNQYQHAVMLFDANFWPVLLNRTLRGLVDNQSLVPGTDLTVSCLWQTGCEHAARIAADHAQFQRSEIADVFPLYERCFVTVGSLLKTQSGRVAGAIVSLAQLTVTPRRMETLLAENNGRADGADAASQKLDFDDWLKQRSDAQQRIQKLSRRESQVTAYVSEGWASKCIASKLGVGVKTIEKHRANAILKLGVNSTAEMVRIAAVAGHRIPDESDAATSDDMESQV